MPSFFIDLIVQCRLIKLFKMSWIYYKVPYLLDSHVVAAGDHVLEGIFITGASDELVGDGLVPLPPRPLHLSLVHLHILVRW